MTTRIKTKSSASIRLCSLVAYGSVLWFIGQAVLLIQIIKRWTYFGKRAV